MKLLDILHAPWAILPDRLEEIQAVYATHMRGEKIDVAAIEAKIGRPLANEARRYEVADGVAVVPMVGVVAQRMNLFMQISGGVSSQLLARDLREAAADPAVTAIVLAIDSPGGTVAGTPELADVVRQISEQKTVVAWTDGTMASAAYWIGAAADAIYISSDVVQVGSIGVVATHTDVSRAREAMGVKTTEIVAGRYKRVASELAPLSEEGRAVIQAQVDQLYETFLNAVARYRGVSAERVHAEMADGRLFLGKMAMTAGLVDGVSTLDALVANLRAGQYQRARTAGAAVIHQPNEKDHVMDRKTLDAEHQDLVAEIRAEGAAAELARVRDVRDIAVPGHAALIEEMMFDGKTTGPEAAVRILAAEKAQREALASAMHEAAPAPAPAAPSASAARDDKPKSREELHQLAKEYQAANACDYMTAVLAVAA